MDVSGNQTLQQIREAAADPTNDFMIVKATQGEGYVSSAWPESRDAAGQKYLGPYCYPEPPGNDPIKEMQHFLATAGDVSGRVLCIDEEFFITANNRDTLTPEQEAKLATDWLTAARYLHLETGGTPLIYTNWLWVPRVRRGCTVDQWEELVTLTRCWLAQNRQPGQYDRISPKPGSELGWEVVVHQYATDTLDRDWTPDLFALKELAVP